MKQSIEQIIPKPLLSDIFNDHCVPIIGAGFSRNADLTKKNCMPLWKDMGDFFSKEMDETSTISPMDAISSYEHEYGKVKLVEKLNELLFINEAKPGSAHEAFCKLPFEVVVTTNFDCLLEKTYDSLTRYCHTVIGEEELSINPPSKAVTLLKLHGDLHHPERLIASEKDYDTFLDRYPLLATFLSNLLISNTPLFIGYSLDDPDFRHIWQIIDERLGRLRRKAYAISMSSSKSDLRRFERRNVKVITLKSNGSYNQTLTKLFSQLDEYWKLNTSTKLIPIKEETRKEFFLPSESTTRLCLFVVPNSLLSFYQTYVFPMAESNDFVPITIQDNLLPNDNIIAKELAILDKAEIIVLDYSPETAELVGLIKSTKKAERKILCVTEPGNEYLREILNVKRISRPKDIFSDNETMLAELENWFSQTSKELLPVREEEPARLLNMGECRAAFISAMTLLESSIRDYYLKRKTNDRLFLYNLRQNIKSLEGNVFTKEETDTILGWLVIRNRILHENISVSYKTTKKTVEECRVFVRRIREGI